MSQMGREREGHKEDPVMVVLCNTVLLDRSRMLSLLVVVVVSTGQNPVGTALD